MSTLNIEGISAKLANFNDSPLIICQKIIKDISENISQIYYSDKDAIVINNEIIFQDKSILLFGFMQLKLVKPKADVDFTEIRIKFIGDVDITKYAQIIEITVKERNMLYQELLNYCFLMEFFNKKFDDSITIDMVKQVSSQIENIYRSGINTNKYWLIPYQNKIERLYDKSQPIKNADIWNKYSYILKVKIRKESKPVMYYQLWKVYDNNLDKSKSIENLRFLEEDLLMEYVLPQDKIYKFIYNLFYYGEFITV